MTDDMVTFGNGNVFADLGVPDPEVHLAKSRLVSKIASVIRERGLSQVEAATLTGVPQPKISGLMRGQFREFTSDRLFRMLNKLGVDIDMTLADRPEWSPGMTTVQMMEDMSSDFAPAMAP